MNGDTQFSRGVGAGPRAATLGETAARVEVIDMSRQGGEGTAGRGGTVARRRGEGGRAGERELVSALLATVRAQSDALCRALEATSAQAARPIGAAAATAGARPVARLLRAWAYNPVFTRDAGTAAEPRLITREGTPLAFVVPDGCDGMTLSFGAIEPNPDHGCDTDLDQLVTVGAARVDGGGLDGPLAAGGQVAVVVPWRAASSVNLPAGLLRVAVWAHFYAAPAAGGR